MVKRSLFILMFLASLCAVSCKTPTNAQKATKAAKERYKYIKHDCHCHSFVEPVQEEKNI